MPVLHDLSTATEVKGYIRALAALLALTLVTVLLSRLDIGWPVAVFVALSVAIVKAAVVGGAFMHLSHERPAIYALLLCTLVFLAGLLLLPVVTYWDRARF